MNESKKMKPDGLMLNGTDDSGNVIERIYFKSVEYTIYRTKNSLRIHIDDDCKNLEKYLDNHDELGIDLARIYSWLPENLSWSEPVNKQIARAMGVNIKGKHNDAKIMLTHAEDRIIKLKTIQGRLQYTVSSFVLVGFILLVLVLIGLESLEVNNSYLLCTKIAFCGALGGVLSVSTGYPSLIIDIDANAITNCMIGVSRILISISAALFSFFAVKSDIIDFSYVSNDYGVYLIAMIAGFSEKLIPSIMNNLSEKNNNLDTGAN